MFVVIVVLSVGPVSVTQYQVEGKLSGLYDTKMYIEDEWLS